MKDIITEAIKALIKKAEKEETKSHEALQFTQAALNLAHAEQVLQTVK